MRDAHKLLSAVKQSTGSEGYLFDVRELSELAYNSTSKILDKRSYKDVGGWEALLSRIDSFILPYPICVFDAKIGKNNTPVCILTQQEEVEGGFKINIAVFFDIPRGYDIVVEVNKQGEVMVREQGRFMMKGDSPYWEILKEGEPEAKGVLWSSLLAFFDVAFYLMFLNCKNVDIVRRSAPQKLKKKHKKKNNIDLPDYYILKVKPSSKHFDKGGSIEDCGKRFHYVRGHFKDVNNLFGRGIKGRFWWSPQARGDSELGVIKKEYKL